MSSRSAAKRIARPASKPVTKSAPKKAKAKLAKVTKFPTASVKKPLPAAKKSSPPPPPARKAEPAAPRGMPALTPPKQVQEPKQSLARSFYWSELRVGDDLPPLSKPTIDRVQIARYASASMDFNRLHLDEPPQIALAVPTRADEPHAPGLFSGKSGRHITGGGQCKDGGGTSLKELATVHTFKGLMMLTKS